MPKKVLVAEEIANEGIEALRGRGYQVDVLLNATPEELVKVIGAYDALVVRSGTQVTSELLDAATNLKIIGRAGVTVDNIDLEAAASHGVIVCNAPASNIISAAEHTMALLLACARNIPQANASVHSNIWTRHRFMGTELYGKTLAIFGLGRIGSLVAERAAAFGMKLVAYDPYCSPERAAQLDVDLYENMADLLPIADFITVHLPLTEATYGMFGPNEYAAMKNGVILVNPARGGIFQVDSLADFVAAGKVAACGIDVFEEEPCLDSPLHELENAILTPHISAVTREAQVRAGEEIAEYIWAGLEGSIVPTAINNSVLPPEIMDTIKPYVPACKMMGHMVQQILGGIPKKVNVCLEGSISELDPAPLVTGVVDGILSYKNLGAISLENTKLMSERHGILLNTSTSDNASEYSSDVRITADGIEIASTLYGIDQLPRIVSIMGYKIDIAPAKQSLVFEYEDSPGKIGTIGTILGNDNVNITTMQIGNKPEEKCALVYMNVDGQVSDEVIDKLKTAIDLKNLWYIKL